MISLYCNWYITWADGMIIKKDLPYHQLKLVVDTPWIIPAALGASFFMFSTVQLPRKRSFIPHQVGRQLNIPTLSLPTV
jgi:hypothetical protein